MSSPDDTTDRLRAALAQGGFARADFGEAVTAWLWAQFMADRWARLDQAKVPEGQKTRLAQVYTDIATDRSGGELAEHLRTCEFATVSVSGAWERQLRGGLARRTAEPLVSLGWGSKGWGTRYVRPSLPRTSLVLIGGPGQGKTTFTQMLAQCHRARMLAALTQPSTLEAEEALREFGDDCRRAGVESPARPMLPLRLDLPRFAAWKKSTYGSVLDYITNGLRRGAVVHSSDVALLIRRLPWLLILDGLDEVPAGAGRDDVVEQVVRFIAAFQGATGSVLVTTRPQGYQGEFGSVQHRQILPLDKPHAERYARRLLDARYADRPDEHDTYLERLLEALHDDATSRLLQTPLQVTILATLVAQIGRAPRERWRLFSEYYRAVYSRETGKGGEVAKLLGGNREHIDAIHRHVGVLLQATSEHAGRTDATLSSETLHEVARLHLEAEGFSAERAASLADQIVRAALDRLVFLVELHQGGRLGFEIRSLQEFMAAWALTTGSDAQVLARLRTIAPHSHWRNTYVLSVGSLFDGGATSLRDAATIDLCATTELREVAADVALDLLDDRTVLSRPKVATALLDLILADLDAVLDVRKCVRVLGDESLRADLDALPRLRAAVFQAIESGGVSALGAWSTLVAMTVAKDEEAHRFARAHWPPDPVRALRLARDLEIVEAWEHERSGEEGVRLSPELLDVSPWQELVEVEPGPVMESRFHALEPREWRPWPLPLRASPLADYAVWTRLGLPLPAPNLRDEPAEPAPRDDSPVLRRVILRGVRAHVDVDLALPSPPPGQSQCVLVLGENGSGKTTLLRALAFALVDPTIADAALQQSASRYGNPSGDAASADCVVETDRGVFHTEIALRNGLEVARPRSARDVQRPFVLAYGCRRGSAMGNPDRDPTSTPFDDVSTLFDRPGSLVHGEAWLRNLHGAGNGDAQLFADLTALLTQALPGVSRIHFEEGRLRVEGADLGAVDFAALSDGYLTTAGLILDIAYRWKLRAARLGQRLEPGFARRMTGVVLVDEIDLHLHPVWQMRVLNDLRGAFPRLTFVGSTHNPLTLVGARAVVVLERAASGVRARVLDEDARLMTAAQIYRSFFGIHDLFPHALGEKLRRYGLLAGDPARSDAEQDEMERLRAELVAERADPGWDPVPRSAPAKASP